MNSKTKSLDPKMISIKGKTKTNTIIFITGILFSTILLLLKISWLNIDWKIPFIPLMIAAQIIFIATSIKNRYRKI